MPPTIIKIKTFMCPLGVGRLGEPGSCRFHRAVNNMTADNKCPIHGLELVKTTLPKDMITVTVPGVELIEDEIVTGRTFLSADISTPAALASYRLKRLKDIADAIAEARPFEDV